MATSLQAIPLGCFWNPDFLKMIFFFLLTQKIPEHRSGSILNVRSWIPFRSFYCGGGGGGMPLGGGGGGSEFLDGGGGGGGGGAMYWLPPFMGESPVN
jgi:hypothetical protein